MSTEALVSQRLFSHLAGAELPGWDEVAAGVRVRHVERGAQVFGQGVPHPYLYVVRRGLLKLVYLADNGDDWIKSFIAEGQFFASLAALTPGGSTSFLAEAIEDSELEQFDYRDLAPRADASLPWQRMLSRALMIYGTRKEARERELLTLSPADRYRAFLRHSPGVAERVLQRDLARHLGVTPVSLSRLKARVKAVPPG
jgi:CRP/FNR family transcriptional regulator